MNNLDNNYKFAKYALWDMPVYMNRQNPVPLDGTSIFFSYDEAVTYAATDPVAYPGQIISVIESDVVTVYKINNGLLEEIGAGKGTIVVDNYSAALEAATEDNIGQLIYASDSETKTEGEDEEAKKIEYSAGPYIVTGEGQVAKLGTTSATGDIAGDVESLKGDVATIKGNYVKQVKSADGELLISVTEDPETGAKIAAISTSQELKDAIAAVGKAGKEAVKYVEGDDIPEGKEVGDIKEEAVPATGLIKDVADLKNSLGDYTINIESIDGTEDSEFAKVYTITQGDETWNINIPRDQFLSSVDYIASASETDVAAQTDVVEGEPYLKFTWNLENKSVTYVSIKDLIDTTYSADETYIKQDDDNKFSLDIDAVKAAILGEGDDALDKKVEDIESRLSDLEDNQYEHPEHTAHDLGLYKIANDDKGHVSNVEAVSTEDITYLLKDDEGKDLYDENGAAATVKSEIEEIIGEHSKEATDTEEASDATGLIAEIETAQDTADAALAAAQGAINDAEGDDYVGVDVTDNKATISTTIASVGENGEWTDGLFNLAAIQAMFGWQSLDSFIDESEKTEDPDVEQEKPEEQP